MFWAWLDDNEAVFIGMFFDAAVGLKNASC